VTFDAQNNQDNAQSSQTLLVDVQASQIVRGDACGSYTETSPPGDPNPINETGTYVIHSGLMAYRDAATQPATQP
jgi:hypothetical protein